MELSLDGDDEENQLPPNALPPSDSGCPVCAATHQEEMDAVRRVAKSSGEAVEAARAESFEWCKQLLLKERICNSLQQENLELQRLQGDLENLRFGVGGNLGLCFNGQLIICLVPEGLYVCSG